MAEARSSASAMVTFGMVSVPVRLYPMVSEKSVSFKTIHTACGGAIKQANTCPACDLTLTSEDTGKAFPVGKIQLVPLTPEDLELLPLSSSKAIEITGFVDQSQLPFYRFDRTYYLGPDDRQKVGHKAFCLLREALTQSGRFAVAKMARSGKESMVVIGVQGRALFMAHLHWAAEMNAVAGVEETFEDVELSEQEKAMALMLVGSMPDATDTLDTAEDGFKAAVEKLVDAKLNSTLADLPAPTPIRDGTVDLMAQLQASIAAATKPAAATA